MRFRTQRDNKNQEILKIYTFVIAKMNYEREHNSEIFYTRGLLLMNNVNEHVTYPIGIPTGNKSRNIEKDVLISRLLRYQKNTGTFLSCWITRICHIYNSTFQAENSSGLQ